MNIKVLLTILCFAVPTAPVFGQPQDSRSQQEPRGKTKQKRETQSEKSELTPKPTENKPSAESLKQEFQQKLDALFKQNEDAVGAIVHVEFPAKNISWTSAVGFSDKEKTSSLDADQPVLIASNTKTYVAASILRLVEMGRLELDRSLEKSLSKETNLLFEQAGYDTKKLTIKHLLSHTSGIQDYVDDAYFERVKKDPKHQWEKQDQILLSIDKGKPLFEAGEKFSYGDINYLLLTEIIERATEQAFYVAMRELLKFDELDINNTWFKDLEPIPAGSKPMAHQYAEVYDWDSYHLNPSWDMYGGGGLASTAKDAAIFYQYLFEGKIIEDKDLLNSMSTYVLPAEQSKYCLGIFRFNFATDLYYHGGWWGTDVAYSPDANASVAMFTMEKGKRDVFALYSRELLESLAEMSDK
jgi:D-alanyl-D-alanine carboxypeptidase